MRKVIVFGYFGQDNAGDDWFLRFFLAHSSHKYSEVVVYSAINTFDRTSADIRSFDNVSVVHKLGFVSMMFFTHRDTNIVVRMG